MIKAALKLLRDAANDWIVVFTLYAMASSVYSRNWGAVIWQFFVIMLVLIHNIRAARYLSVLELINLGITQLKENVDAHEKVCPLAQKTSGRNSKQPTLLN